MSETYKNRKIIDKNLFVGDKIEFIKQKSHFFGRRTQI